MTDPREIAERALAQAKPRAFHRALFNMANAYSQAADLALNEIGRSGNADFAGPAIMCRSFAIELLLKFFLTVHHPGKRFSDIKALGVNLRGHTYSSLFDRIDTESKQAIARSYSDHTCTPTDVVEFRRLLVALGDEPFVTWRYIYEAEGTNHLDAQLLTAVTHSLGLAAQAAVRAIVEDQ